MFANIFLFFFAGLTFGFLKKTFAKVFSVFLIEFDFFGFLSGDFLAGYYRKIIRNWRIWYNQLWRTIGLKTMKNGTLTAFLKSFVSPDPKLIKRIKKKEEKKKKLEMNLENKKKEEPTCMWNQNAKAPK